MSKYVSVRSNWISVDSVPLDSVCDVGFESEDRSQVNSEPIDTNDDTEIHRKGETTDGTINRIILQPQSENNEREDPIIIIGILDAQQYQISSIQVLSNARHIEFYHQEYIGTSQGSRITELENESIYESVFDFDRSYKEISLKLLKLGDPSQLIVYCFQINFQRKTISNMRSLNAAPGLPFDMDKVRSMIDEESLTTNARQFMNDLQMIQRKKQENLSNAQRPDLAQLMFMMKSMNTVPTANTQITTNAFSHVSSPLTEQSSKSEVNEDGEKFRVQIMAMEQRLVNHFDRRFEELKHMIDQRFNHLEEKLNKLENHSE